MAGHPMLGGEPLAVIATADAVRPYSGLDSRFALVADGQWRILADMETVLASTGEDGYHNPTDIRP